MSEMDVLLDIRERLKSQDNRMTANPMFCVQIKVRDVGYDPPLCEDTCWLCPVSGDVAYGSKPQDGGEWFEYGYMDRWETVMVAFTEKGCDEYLKLDGHNVRRRAHGGEVRIYVDSFNRCPEMIRIREALIGK